MLISFEFIFQETKRYDLPKKLQFTEYKFTTVKKLIAAYILVSDRLLDLLGRLLWYLL